MKIPKKTNTTKKTILLFFFFFLNILTYGQKKTPILQNISNYIITRSDTIKIQRYNSTEYHKLGAIDLNYSYTFKDAVNKIEAYLDARSKGEIPDNPDEIEMRFMNLTKLAKTHKVYFDLENYKKELLYYKTQEAEKTKERLKEHNEEVKRQNKLESQRFFDKISAQKRKDSLLTIEIRQKAINDSIEYEKKKTTNEAIEKAIQKQEVKRQIAQKKYNIETKEKRKLENEKKRNQRREAIINKYGLVNGEAILNHKVKIGWTKSMCITSWGKPYDINRTTTTYGSHEQYVYSLKKYLYFENGILTAIQD
jgi:hypothetical protein